MLGNKHRMPTHWRLLAVIWDDRRRKPRSDEVGSMVLNGSHALVHYVLPVLFAQMKLCAESGFLQAQKRMFIILSTWSNQFLSSNDIIA